MKKILAIFGLLILANFPTFAQTGITWNSIENVANSDYGNNYPRIAMDGSGNPLVSWGNGDYMMFANWDGSSFSAPDTISDQTLEIANATWMGPEIATFGDTIYGVYKEKPESESSSKVWCTRSFNGGESFSEPVAVNGISDNLSRFPTITVDDSGHPIIAYMEFSPGFIDPRWVVVRSNDYGMSFGPAVKASGWSDPDSEVCDCCPAVIKSNGANVAVIYRDNDNDLRDCWAGISADGGLSFTGGIDVDEQGWEIMSCPSSGPDGFFIGDSLYSTFMSAASGQSTTFFNSSHIPSLTSNAAANLSPAATSNRNYPRTDNQNGAAVYVWKEASMGDNTIMLRYASNIETGLPNNIDTIAYNAAISADVAISNDKIVVVWQDASSGTVKYRIGTINSSELQKNEQTDFNVYPNPSNSNWNISTSLKGTFMLTLRDVNGKVLYMSKYSDENLEGLSIDARAYAKGVYFLTIEGEQTTTISLIKK